MTANNKLRHIYSCILNVQIHFVFDRTPGEDIPGYEDLLREVESLCPRVQAVQFRSVAMTSDVHECDEDCPFFGVPDEKREDECTVSLPLYEWDLLAILLEVSAQHARFCEHLENPPSGAPEWILGEHQNWEVQTITQPRGIFHELIVLLDRLADHFGQDSNDDAELAHWVPDLSMRRALMKRYHDLNGDPEAFLEDEKHGVIYQHSQCGMLIWYMARRIEAQMTRMTGKEQ